MNEAPLKRDVYRPTSRPVLKDPDDSLHLEWVMVPFDASPSPPGPERTPITVVSPAKWADVGNVYVVGSTVFAETAGFTGGLTDTTTYRWRTQTRAAADASWINGSWTNYTDHAEEVSFPLTAAGQVRFQCQARDTGVDPVEQINSFAGIKDVESPSTLVYSSPVVTGEPWVGETLRCSEPVVSGGVGPYQFDYFWVDETNAIVWEAPKMAPTTIVTTYDIGKMMKCLVQITDKGWDKGESITVESNSIGPIGQRTIGTLAVTVDGTANTEDDVVPTRNGLDHVILATTDGNATGLQYDFTLRSGQAGLSITGNSCIVSIQGASPGSVAIDIRIQDFNTVEQQAGQRVSFYIGE